MLEHDVIYCWKANLDPELLWRLVCTGATVMADLVPMAKQADGKLVATDESILLELGDFAVEYEGEDEDFPVELRTLVRSGGDAVAINGMPLQGSFVTMRFNPIRKVAVVENFGQHNSVRFVIPPEYPIDRRSEQIRANFLRSLGVTPKNDALKGIVAVTSL